MRLLRTALPIVQMRQEKDPYRAEHMEQRNTTMVILLMEDHMQMLHQDEQK
jgi:hypothetical protein